MKAHHRTRIALAICATLALPAAFSQSVQGQAATKVGADIPNPVPAAQQATEHMSDRAAQATDRAVDATAEAQQRTAAQAQDTQHDAQETTQDAMQSHPPAPPVQSQGQANATAQASVTQRALWDRLDADRDGGISAAEAEADAGFEAGFARMDSDGDGVVTDAEYAGYARSEPAPGAAQAAGHSQVAVDGLWRQYDADADGKLSAAEVEADADISGSFSAIDDDSDGYVTEAEYRAYAQTNREPGTP